MRMAVTIGRSAGFLRCVEEQRCAELLDVIAGVRR
jgi:hypothetical protein